MVNYELRAQHRPQAAGREVHLWHIVPRGHFVGLCRKALDAVADTRPLGELQDLPVRTWCQRCVSAYRRTAAAPLSWDDRARLSE